MGAGWDELERGEKDLPMLHFLSTSPKDRSPVKGCMSSSHSAKGVTAVSICYYIFMNCFYVLARESVGGLAVFLNQSAVARHMNVSVCACANC
jgi:hypothetical protein